MANENYSRIERLLFSYNLVNNHYYVPALLYKKMGDKSSIEYKYANEILFDLPNNILSSVLEVIDFDEIELKEVMESYFDSMRKRNSGDGLSCAPYVEDLVIKLLRLEDKDTFLDLGCGVGSVIANCRKHNSNTNLFCL